MDREIYSPKDLSLEEFQDLELKNKRRNEILETLIAISNTNGYLSLHEKEFLFQNANCIEHFKNHHIFDDTYFMHTYLIHAFDLHGIGVVYKWTNRIKTKEEYSLLDHIRSNSKTHQERRSQLIKANFLIEISKEEIQQSLNYLREKATAWELFLDKKKGQTNEKLLKEFAIETFTQLKELKKQTKKTALGENAFLFRKFQLFLYSKYAFLTAYKVIETFKNGSFYPIKIHNEIIRFNEYSLTHILMRHYAQAIRNYDFIRQKSIHIGDFPFNEIHLKLQNILLRIEQTNALPNNYFNSNVINIRFNYKGFEYFIGTKIDKNQNERGKVPFRRIETFHLIEDQLMLDQINRNFYKLEIDKELTLNIKAV